MLLKIRFWPALTLSAVMAATVCLGFWQRSRAHQKAARAAQILRYQHAPPLRVTSPPLPLARAEYHRLSARGRFIALRVVYLDNRFYHDQPGFYVLMPLALDSGGYVLVNRGWLPRQAASRIAIAPYRTPAGEVEIVGIARAGAGRAFALGGREPASRRIRQNLDLAAYQAQTRLPLQPFVIWQTNESNDALVRDWPPADVGIARNYGYMAQWWGMAAAALILGLYAARRAALKEGAARDRF
jgi:surfeit locus 1 family protein